MKTALQELLDDLKQECKAYYENNEIYLKSCIEAEKQQHKDTYFKGWHRDKGNRDEDFEQYYNETFNK
jgi:hypothetical protein